MKKVVKIVFAFVFMLVFFTTITRAATTDELIAYASKTFTIAGKQVKLSDADVLKVKRYLSENPVTGSDADKIIAKANQIIAIMNEQGVSDPTQLSKEKKNEVLGIAQEAAAITGATLTYDSTNKSVAVYKNGKKVESIALENYKLVQTGSDNIVYVVTGVIGTVAVIAIATTVILKRKRANV